MIDTIPITREAAESLLRTGEADPRALMPRADGRYDLAVGRDLRDRLDRLVVTTGLSYSEVLLRLEAAAIARGSTIQEER